VPPGESAREARPSTLGAVDRQATARLAGLEAKLDEVESSLGRLEDGTYWACPECRRSLAPSEAGEPPTVRDCPVCGLDPDGRSEASGS
jgi:rubrerythrin